MNFFQGLLRSAVHVWFILISTFPSQSPGGEDEVCVWAGDAGGRVKEVEGRNYRQDAEDCRVPHKVHNEVMGVLWTVSCNTHYQYWTDVLTLQEMLHCVLCTSLFISINMYISWVCGTSKV